MKRKIENRGVTASRYRRTANKVHEFNIPKSNLVYRGGIRL